MVIAFFVGIWRIHVYLPIRHGLSLRMWAAPDSAWCALAQKGIGSFCAKFLGLLLVLACWDIFLKCCNTTPGCIIFGFPLTSTKLKAFHLQTGFASKRICHRCNGQDYKCPKCFKSNQTVLGRWGTNMYKFGTGVGKPVRVSTLANWHCRLSIQGWVRSNA